MFFTYLIYAKMAIVSFIVTVFCVVILILLVKKMFKKLVILVAITISGLIWVIALSQNAQQVLYKIIKFEPFNLGNDQWVYFLSMNSRYAIWDCNWSLIIKKNNWLTGAGLDHQQDLNKCYSSSWKKYGMDTNDGIDEFFLENTIFNAHNEFLQSWIDLGILGFISILTVFVVSIRLAIINRNYLYFAFLTLFLICCLSESMLARQKGIVFYAFFNSFFAFWPKQENAKKVQE